MNKVTKILFLGTSDFAVPALQALVDSGYEVVGVVTVPDKPVGRKKLVTPPPVKVLAHKYNLQIFQPEKLKENDELLKQLLTLDSTIGVTVAYGKIIPEELLGLPKLGVINIHPSLLPKYRGPSPIQTALLNGDKETGVTIMQVDAQVDHGAILAQEKMVIEKNDNYSSLQTKLAKTGANLLISTLLRYLSTELKPQAQNESKATFTKIIKTEDGEIAESESVEQALNKIRALNPEPGTYTIINGKRLKILEARPTTDLTKPILHLTDGAIEFLKVQSDGGRPMSGQDWRNGQKSKILY